MSHKAGIRFLVGPGYATVMPDFDFETYSEAGYYWDGPADRWRGITKNKPGLPAVGAPVYSEHPSTELLSLAFDLKDGKGDRLWVPGMLPPQELFDHILNGGLLEAWNSSFEFYIWKNVCQARMNWPALPLHQLRCAMSKARSWSLPGALGNAAKVIGAPEQKDKAGNALLSKLSVPRSPTKKDRRLRRTPADEPEMFGHLYGYNVQDIKAEAAVSLMTPDLSPEELDLWMLDQRINTGGVQIDMAALDDCISIINQAQDRYNLELQTITGGAVQAASEIQKIQKWMTGQGVTMRSLDKDNVAAALAPNDPYNLPPNIRRVLEIRASIGAASVKKLFALARQTSKDGRIRDLFAFCGADRTGRFAGRGPQPQNLPNSGPAVRKCEGCSAVYWTKHNRCPSCGTDHAFSAEEEWGIHAVEAALQAISTRNLEYVEKLWGDATAAVAGCLRGLFSAAPGHDLICSDFSAIEAVVLAFMAGEEWRMEVFRTHGKIYEMSAAKITGIPFEEMMQHKKDTGQHHPMRKKIGKVAELASGYAGWVGAWKNFGADKFMNDDEIKQNILAWRKASPMIEEFWGGQWRKDPNRWHFTPELYGIEGAAVSAVMNPGQCFGYRSVSFGVKDDVLYCRLPSGRMLNYHRPRLIPGTAPHGNPILNLTYEGWNSDYKKGPTGWMRLDTYGGKLTENIVQAVARDILAYAMINLDKAGYKIVLHVHDEIVSEVPEGTGSVEEFERIMGTMPPWCADWPVKAAGGWRGKRYRKD